MHAVSQGPKRTANLGQSEHYESLRYRLTAVEQAKSRAVAAGRSQLSLLFVVGGMPGSENWASWA